MGWSAKAGQVRLQAATSARCPDYAEGVASQSPGSAQRHSGKGDGPEVYPERVASPPPLATAPFPSHSPREKRSPTLADTLSLRRYKVRFYYFQARGRDANP